MRCSSSVLLAVVALAGARCGSGSGTGSSADADEVLVVPASLSLRGGESAQLAAQVNDEDGSPIGGAPIAYKTLDAKVLRVSRHGRVTALGRVARSGVKVTSGRRSRTVSVAVVAGRAEELELVSGAGQSGPVGGALPERLVVRAHDYHGNLVGGARVRFEVTSGGGAAEPQVGTTDEQGVASCRWTLGDLAGRQRVTAVLEGAETQRVSLDAEASPGDPARIVRVGDLAQGGAAGSAVSVVVRVTDERSNPARDVEVGWSVVAGGGAVEPATSRTDASGVTRAQWTTGTAVGDNRLEAVVPSAPDAKVGFAVRTVAGVPARVEIHAGSGQTRPPGGALPVTPSVRVTDAHGNPVAGATVRWAVTGGGGRVEGDVATTGPDGVASVGSWTLGDPGDNTLSATVEGVAEPATLTARARGRRVR